MDNNNTELKIGIAVLRKEREAMQREIDLRFEALNTAIALQASEYARRLDLLNGEADRLREMQKTYVGRETYESEQKELRNYISDFRFFKDKTIGKQSIYSVILPAIISLAINMALYFLLK